jgi:hypothetical protein
MKLRFDSARLKIERAQQLIDEFKNQVKTFEDSEFCHIQISPRKDADGNEVSLIVTNTLPTSISLIIGDAFQNLRASLDHMIHQVIAYHNGVGDDRCQFPCADNEIKLIALKTYKQIIETSNVAGMLLIDKIKPYEAANYKLWGLNKLNNIDKHRLLITVAQGTAAALEGVFSDGQRFGVGFQNIRDVLGQENTIKTNKTIAQITSFRKPVPQVFFGKNGFFNDIPVTQVFDEVKSEVLATIESFEELDY